MQYISASAATFSADSNKLVFTTYPAAKTPSQVVWFDLTTLAVSKVQPLKTSRRQVPITNGSARTLAGPKRLLKNQDLGRKELDTTTDDGMDSSSSSDDESDNGDNTETTLQPVGTHVCINAIGTVAVADSTRSLHILHKDGVRFMRFEHKCQIRANFECCSHMACQPPHTR